MYASALQSARSRRNTSFFDTVSVADEFESLNQSLEHIGQVDVDDSLEMTDLDLLALKNNILFRYMNSEKLKSLIRDKTILLKKNKYKQILSKGIECQDNIFIVKTGEISVWIKITRENVKTYKDKIDKYHVNNQLDYSHSKQFKVQNLKHLLLIKLIIS